MMRLHHPRHPGIQEKKQFFGLVDQSDSILSSLFLIFA